MVGKFSPKQVAAVMGAIVFGRRAASVLDKDFLEFGVFFVGILKFLGQKSSHVLERKAHPKLGP